MVVVMWVIFHQYMLYYMDFFEKQNICVLFPYFSLWKYMNV